MKTPDQNREAWTFPALPKFKSAANAQPRRERRKLGQILASRFTVMVVPHDDRQPFRFHINIFLLSIIMAGLLIVTGGFFYLSAVYSGSEQSIIEKTATLTQTQENLDSVLDEVKELLKVYQVFQGSLNTTLKELEISGSATSGISTGSGDLSRLVDIQELSGSEFRELIDIKRLSSSLSSSVQPLAQIGDVLRAQKSILSDIPNFWPVGGGRGIVTMDFGPNIQPFLNAWYIHKGIDIAGPMGLPVLAAANGKVVDARYDPFGYGNMVMLEHKYGFRTRYAHLNSLLVQPGQVVTQGQRIATVGSTGFSTGPHLHFELILGTQVLDPRPFLKIKSEFDRWEEPNYND